MLQHNTNRAVAEPIDQEVFRGQKKSRLCCSGDEFTFSYHKKSDSADLFIIAYIASILCEPLQ
jgi:hypothetical protein